MTVTTYSPEYPTPEPLAFDERSRRVMELRKQVREGTYRPDPGEVALAILAEWIASGEVVLRASGDPSVETSSERRKVARRFLVQRTVAAEAERAGTLSA